MRVQDLQQFLSSFTEGSDAVKFHEAYSLVGGSLPLIGGPVTIDEFFMRYASMNSNSLAGTLTSGPIPEGDSATLWKEFSKLYRKTHGWCCRNEKF